MKYWGFIPAFLGTCGACGGTPAGGVAAPTSRLRDTGAQLEPIQVTCSPSFPEICLNATDDNCNGLIDEGCGQPLGPIQVAAAWGDAEADVELLVIDPNLESAEVGRFSASGLTKDRDCPGEGAGCHGMNVETIFLPEGDALRGNYSVRLSLERLGRRSDPVKVRLGLRFGSSVRTFDVRLRRVGEVVVVPASI